jgi:hypothetical protein
MKAPKATARLAGVVKSCGKPEPVTLWVNPRKNPPFQAALKTNRVMTIKQETVGTRKDFGVVGFRREPNVSYWIFPEPLDAFEGKRIIGIDYSVLQEPRGQTSDVSLERPPRTRSDKHAPRRHAHSRTRTPQAAASPTPARPPQPPRPIPRFRVTVRCVSFVELPQTVQAGTKREAKEKALAALAGKRIDFSRGTQSRTALRVERVRDGEKESAAMRFRRLRGLSDQPEGGEEDAK